MKTINEYPAPLAAEVNVAGEMEAVHAARTNNKRGGRRRVMPINNSKTCVAWEPFSEGVGNPLDRMAHVLIVLRRRGITSSLLQAIIALHVRRRAEVNLRDLAEALEVTTANITNVADNLEHLGLAARSLDGMDRRKILIGLTPTGLSFVRWLEELLDSKSSTKSVKQLASH